MYFKYLTRLLAFLTSSSLLCTVVNQNKAFGLVVKTKQHQLHYVIAETHEQLTFLKDRRIASPELVFWSGMGTTDEKIYILALEESIEKHKSTFEGQKLPFTLVYDTVEITYVEDNPDHPNKAPVATHLEHDEASEKNNDEEEEEDSEEIQAQLENGAAIDDEIEVELLIHQRKNKLREGAGTLEMIAETPKSVGLLQITKLIGVSKRDLPLYQGLLYRIQSIQTLRVGNTTTEQDGEWQEGGDGIIPVVGEYLGVSFNNERDGNNPFITAEENKNHWKNEEYEQNKTKSVLWMFVPTEYPNFYEIRNRNYPMSLLVWMFDLEELEFVLGLETRRNYLHRYQADGELRNRALFSVEMISETYNWELRHNRPKFYLTTYNQNHVYLYDSKKKRCSILVIRNSATDSYAPIKTDKVGRPLDMFYITRTNVTGKFSASVHSFAFDKTIVDVFASSTSKGFVKQLGEFDMINRGPITTTQYLYEEISHPNKITFRFRDSLSPFQTVTVESVLPSFGVAPIIHAGVIGEKTDTKEITKEFIKLYKIQDKISLSTGEYINASIIFQYAENFDNPFTCMLEVTEMADRLLWDRSGKPRFVKLSLPGELIQHSFKERASFHYERVIEKREVAYVIEIRGNMIGSYGLRGFVKKTKIPYSGAGEACENENE
ncbi:unnamed protein product [Orchesella dallaii]|uniref:Uncharacterized protein n=1 Tax=Orchesella dallaii TaxID=48710 RepID=A0ABP1R0K4_9HEXA